MNKKTLMCKSFKVLHLFVIAALLALTLSIPSAHATPPIGTGQTIEFASSSAAVSGDTAQIRAVIALDLDSDGDLDLVTGQASGTNEVRAWENDGTPFNGAWSTSGAAVGDTGTDANASALAAADLDHDGYVDLAAGGTDDQVYIFKGNATPFGGAWTTSQDISASSAGDVNGLAIADIDRDGNPDIISVHTSGSGNEVTVWENPYVPTTNEDIFDETWTAHNLSYSTNKTANAVAVADVDRDGYTDLVVGYDGTTAAEVVVWENTYDTSAWTFSEHDVDSGSGTVNSVAVGDVDNDGYVDVVQGGIDDEVVVWENTYDGGAWTFSEHSVASTLGDDVEGVVLADLDNDGYLEVAAGTGASATNEVLAFRNDADAAFDWSFTQLSVGAVGTDILGLAAADLDNDGDADLATGRDNATSEYEVAAWQNDLPHRNMSFDSTATGVGSHTGTVRSVAVGDLDGDGDLDIVSGATDNAVKVWSNDGTPFDAGWSTSRTVGSHTNDVTSVAVGDLDGDGDLDIVSGGRDNAVKVWSNEGTPFDAAWSTSQTVGSHTDRVRSVAVGDLDGDGDLDIVSGGNDNAVRVWENDGTPFDAGVPWTSQTVGSHTGDVASVAVGDLDGDGDLDIVSGGEDDAVRVWENDGTPFDAGWSTSQTVGSHTGNVNSVAVGDLDGDGDLDIVSGGNDDAVKVWSNEGAPFDAGWSTSQTVGSHTGTVYSVAVGDLDGDGDLDIVSGASDNAVKVWENDGTPFDAGWSTSQTVGGHTGTVRSVAVGDLDGDGDLDIVSGAADNAVNAWQNIGGSAGLAVTDTSPDTIANSTEDDILKVVFTHNGIAADRNLEMNKWDLDILQSNCSTPLSSSEANAIIDNLRVRLDDSDGTFETDGSDALVTDGDISDLSLTDGVQTITFSNGDTNVQVDQDATATRTYWISVLTTSDASSQSPNSFCINFDPDADALVEGKTPDFSVGLRDTSPTNGGAGAGPTAVTLHAFTARSAAGMNGFVLPLALVGLGVVGGLVLRQARRRPNMTANSRE